MGAGDTDEFAARALGALAAMTAGGWLTTSGVLQWAGEELLPAAEEHVDHWLAHGAVALTCLLLYIAASAVYVLQRDAAGRLGRDAFALLAFALVVTACAETAVVGSSFALGTASEVYAWAHRAQEVAVLVALATMAVFGALTAWARSFHVGAGVLVALGSGLAWVTLVPLGLAWLWLGAGLVMGARAPRDTSRMAPSA